MTDINLATPVTPEAPYSVEAQPEVIPDRDATLDKSGEKPKHRRGVSQMDDKPKHRRGISESANKISQYLSKATTGSLTKIISDGGETARRKIVAELLAADSNKVLLCMDGTEVGAKILAYAAEVLPKNEFAVCLTTVVEKPAGGLYDMKADTRAVKERAQTMLDRLKKEAENLGFECVCTFVSSGFVARECLAEYGVKHNFRKIFVGASGKDFITRKLRGTTADYIKATCVGSEVIVVPRK